MNMRWLLMSIAALMVVLATPWAAAQNVIGTGDYVYVDVYRQPEMTGSFLVNELGMIEVPYAGPMKVVGMTESEASNHVRQSLTRVLRNPRVTVSRAGGMALDVRPRSAQMRTTLIPLQNSNAEQLSETLRQMTSEGGSVGHDPDTNSLLITDTPETLQNMTSIIMQLDQMRSQLLQVRIETKIAEVRVGALKELGVRWWAQGTDVGGGVYPTTTQDAGLQSLKSLSDALGNERLSSVGNSNTGSGGIGRRFLDEPRFDRRLQIPVQVPTSGEMFLGLLVDNVDIGLLIDALESKDQAELLANPMITAINHKRSEIKMTDEFPYTEFNNTSTGVSNFTTKFLELGIKVAVTPHVYDDGGQTMVKLELEPEVSSASGSANGVPIRTVRSSQSTARVRDGQTLTIGGIFRTNEKDLLNGVPGLSRVPVLGNLFKHKERSKERTELLVFVTPRVMRGPEDMDGLAAVSDTLPEFPTLRTLRQQRME